ncbi:hypothetical protein [Solidesulfovibrio carbinolicus]|uniref:hypothetical protein n=1 Tax=Solidesulfovibrio carbinolicus TaxID=296842 RepID=UPI001011107E|nr:hypothetical protein [Solidesulfovibrio carbinolicus]
MTPEQKQQQIEFIKRSEKILGFNAGEMARALFVDYDTYGKWRRGQRELKAAPTTSIRMLVVMKICNAAKEDAFTMWTNQIQP